MRQILNYFAAMSLVAASLSNTAQAESAAELVRAAKGQARSISSEDVAAAKARLLEDAQALEAFLDASPAEQATAWRELVKFDSMMAELGKEETPSRSVLNQSLIAYRGDEAGLEAQVFTDIRKSLGEYMDRLYIFAAEDFAADYDRRIDQLAAQLEAYDASPSTRQAVAIGRSLEWFDRAGQIASVLSAIRERYSHPNLHVAASKQLVASGVREPVDTTEGLRDCILGTSIHGTTRLTGNVDLELIPSDGRAAFDITLAGNAVSRNVGYNRGVTIYSTGYTNVSASKRVYVDAAGVTSDWARARAATRSNVRSIAAKCALVRRIAWKQVGQKKGQAERIASGKAAGRVSRRVDLRAGETLAQADDNFQDKFRAPLVRRESFPELFDLKTTDTQLLVRLLRAGTAQLAAPGPAPDLAGDFDLAARVHESMAGNFSESMIGGVMLTDEQIVQMYQDAELEVPPDLKITLDSEPWAITFARSQPISVEFANGGVKIAVLCQYLHRGEGYGAVKFLLKDEKTDKSFRPDIRISREYDLTTPNNGGLQLVAKGDLSVELVDQAGEAHPYGLPQASAVGLLKNKFGAMLKPKLPEEATDGLQLRGPWARMGKLKARLANSADGWLSIGWEQVLSETQPVDAVAEENSGDESAASQAVADETESNDTTELVQTASVAR